MLRTRTVKWRQFWLRQWRCRHCGALWELLLSPRFPERYTWHPDHDCEETMSYHVMRVMDSTGHTKATWNPENAEETAAVKKLFDELLGKRYRAFRVMPDGAEGDAMEKFDPHAGMIILAPPIAGG